MSAVLILKIRRFLLVTLKLSASRGIVGKNNMIDQIRWIASEIAKKVVEIKKFVYFQQKQSP